MVSVAMIFDYSIKFEMSVKSAVISVHKKGLDNQFKINDNYSYR